MTDRSKLFKAGSRNVGFKKAVQAVDLQAAFKKYDIDFTNFNNGENEK